VGEPCQKPGEVVAGYGEDSRKFASYQPLMNSSRSTMKRCAESGAFIQVEQRIVARRLTAFAVPGEREKAEADAKGG
jgi:hypothetical protein